MRLAKGKLRISLDGTVKPVKVAGKVMKAWFETGSVGYPDLSEKVAYAFIPEVGPYLQCEYDSDKREYWCLRLTSVDKK